MAVTRVTSIRVRLTGVESEWKMFRNRHDLPSRNETIMLHRTGRRLLSGLVLGALASVLLSGRLDAANDPEKDKEDEARREQNLKNMKRSAAQHTLTSSDTDKRTFKYQESALLRSSNPVSGTKDGATFLWTDRGRPQA
jgi:hypothetical protein